MDKDKENVDGNLSVDVVKSSQGSPFTSNTQSLHLELLDEDVNTSDASDNKVLNSQTISQEEMSATEKPNIGASPSDSETMQKNEKRSATEALLTDIEEQKPGKLPKKEISVITLSDSLNESSENTFSLNELQADESRQTTSNADDSVIVVESQEPSFESIPPSKNSILTDNNSPAVVNYPETSTPGRLTDCTVKDDKTAVDITESPVSEKETVPLETSNFDQNLKKNDCDNLDTTVNENELQNKEEEAISASQPVNEDDKNTTLPMPMSSPEDDGGGGYVMVAMKSTDFRRLNDTKDMRYWEVLGNWKYDGDLAEIGSRLKTKCGLNKRLSEFSSLSGTSSGYNADSSSGISSEGSKRDRLSILPEANIAPHHVISPLPQQSFLKPKLQRKVIIPTPRTTDYELKLEMRVFAKWVEKTTTKYWPGKIHQITEENQRFLVLFDDGFEKSLKKEDILPADCLVPGNRVNVNDEETLTHNSGAILSYADLTTPNRIFYEIQLESDDSDPVEPVKKVSHDQVHMELDQWNDIKGEIKGTQTKMADVSLDNLLTGKRRSKPMTPIKETPTKTPKKRGGSNVETSATEGEDGGKNISARKKIRKRANEKRNVDLPMTTDDEDKDGKSASKKSELFKGLKFMITQGKHNPEEKDLSGMDSETEEEEEEDSLKEEVFDKKSLRKKIIDHSGTVLAKFPDKTKEKISSNVSLLPMVDELQSNLSLLF